MKAEDRRGFSELLRVTMEVYDREISPEVIAIWWESLKRFEYAAVRSAFSRHVQNVDTGQYPPKPAEIIRTIEGGASEGRALGAWAKVMEAVRRVGHWQSVVFDDALIHAVIEDMGGWIALCQMTEDEVPFRGSEFQKRYRAFIHNPPQTYPSKLLGVVDGENQPHGYRCEEPILIGSAEACQAVLAYGSSAPRLTIRRMSEAVAQTASALPDRPAEPPKVKEMLGEALAKRPLNRV